MYNLIFGIMATITTEFGKLSSKKQRAVYLLVRDKKITDDKPGNNSLLELFSLCK